MPSVILTLSLCALVVYTRAQTPPETCDFATRMCINGICELQDNQQIACTCNPEFMPDPSNPLLCNPMIPSCNQVPGMANVQCVNGQCQAQITGISTCVCFPGYTPNINNPNMCDDIDECQWPSTGCATGGCLNMPGDFFCTACMTDYRLDLHNKCQFAGTSVNPSEQQGTHPWLWMWMMDGFS